MKKITILSFFTMVLLFIVPVQSRIINVDVGNFYFSDVSFDAAVGDTIIWTLIEGTHTTTSTLVPAGAATWDYTFTGVSDTYTYVITIPGVYEYICAFHPSSMIGSFSTPADIPYTENFEYPVDDLLAYHGWVNHSGSGSFVTVALGSLNYPGYPASGFGNHIALAGGSGSREDIHRGIANVSSGACYAAFLVNVLSSEANDGYVAHFMPPIGSFSYRARFFMMDDGAGNLKFGISKGSSSIVSWVTADFVYSQTYLIVIKYEYVGDATGDDDIVKLFINPTIGDPEPANGDAENTDVADDIEIENFAVRQGGEAHIYQFDGLIVGTSWSDLVPVELVSFSASVNDNSVTLSWITATELNNSGFEVQRSNESEIWENIGFVRGSGTTTEINYYSFTDKNLQEGSYAYKLKQVDLDGTYQFSNIVNVDITTPIEFELSQNYPNPFNPSTIINFSIPEGSQVSLKIYNSLGQEIKTLVNRFMEAGVHTANFNAVGLNSGLYFYRLDAGEFTQVRKMTLIK